MTELNLKKIVRTQRESYRVRVARYNDQIQINYNVIDQLNSYLETMGME